MRLINTLSAMLIVLNILAIGLLSVSASPGTEENEIADPFDENYYESAEKVERIADPLQSYNRAIFKFNDKFYFYLLKPLAKGYRAVLPEKARISVRKMFTNLGMPVRFFNCVLQGKVKGSCCELTRFVVNTTWGIVGLFDPAKSCLHLKEQKEDFGQTLGFYGLKEGFFITWPFLGPSSGRDTIGLAADYFSDPLVYYVDPLIKTGITVTDKVNGTSLRIGEYEDFKKSALDPYVSMRNAYFQYRRNLIKK